MLELWSLGSMPMALSVHVAFSTTLESVLGASDRLRGLGVTPRRLEYLAMLAQPARPEVGVVTWASVERRGP